MGSDHWTQQHEGDRWPSQRRCDRMSVFNWNGIETGTVELV